MSDRRWVVCQGNNIIDVCLQADLPPLPEGAYAMELPDTDDGVSRWYFHPDYGLVMEGAEPEEEGAWTHF